MIRLNLYGIGISSAFSSLLLLATSGLSYAGDNWKKPFSRGGALSINKPFDKGGGLSIDKPFDKGGALSIDKVYVPEKLRIGRVESIAEVIIPICWGNPQNCRGMKPEKATPAAESMAKEANYRYYIIARFTCTDRKTGSVSNHSCEVTKASSKSCQDAKDALDDDVRMRDFCTRCADDIYPDVYWDGTPPSHVQGGSCPGW